MSRCEPAVYRDGFKQPGEGCDDGNTDELDAPLAGSVVPDPQRGCVCAVAWVSCRYPWAVGAFTGPQRVLSRLLPRGVFDSLEAGTRTFALECPCGDVRDLWEAGGVKYEGNQERTLSRCPACGRRTWQHKRKKTFAERREALNRLRHAGEERVFLAAKVWWFSLLVWGTAALVWSLPLFVLDPNVDPAVKVLVAVGSFVLGWIAGPWFWLTTRYRITDRHLILHSGPFRATLELAGISEVSRARRGLGVSFAPDTDCLWVGYPVFGTGGALISPKERVLFIGELDQACPQLIERNGELVPPPRG